MKFTQKSSYFTDMPSHQTSPQHFSFYIFIFPLNVNNINKTVMNQDQPLPTDTPINSPGGSHQDKDQAKAAKTAQILKMQNQIRKMKKWIEMQVELRRNKEQYNRISQDIQNYEGQIRQKKREAISENLMHIEQRKIQRSIRNKETNVVLAKIKESHKERRKRMESLVHQFKQEYDYVYQKKLKQRRDMINQIDFAAIAQHDHELSLQKKRSIRIKTDIEPHTNRRFSKLSPQNTLFFSPKHSQDKSEEEKLKREKIMELVNKRKQYGNRMEREAAKIKISMEILQKVRDEKKRDANPKMFQSYEQQTKPSKKAKLNTNLTGNIESFKSREITNIAKETAPVKDKLNRLRHIVDGYSLQYVNGKEEVLDLMCSASLARANLLLSDC